MVTPLICWLVTLILLVRSEASQDSASYTNLLSNPGFELDLTNNWRISGGSLIRQSDDVFSGEYSVKLFERTTSFDGLISEILEIKKGHNYEFEAWVKLLQNNDSKPWQEIRAQIIMDIPEISVMFKIYLLAVNTFANTEKGWFQLKGGLQAPQYDATNVRIQVRGPDPGIEFLMDEVDFYEIPQDDTWRSQAHVNIENNRKSDVTLTITNPKGDNEEIDIEVSLIKHKFVFGSLLRKPIVLNLTNPELHYEVFKRAKSMFNLGTVQDYKWKLNTGSPQDTNPDFSKAIEMTQAIREAGMDAKGHSIFWNIGNKVPDFIRENYTSDQIPDRLQSHLLYMLNLANGTLNYVDIMNEHLAEHYFEDRTNNKSITEDIYRLTESYQSILGDQAKRQMNEFQCITSGANTQQYYELVKSYKEKGISIQGIGCQGHVKDYVKPDPSFMWRRINVLKELNLDIFISEFDLSWPNKLERADWFEDSIRAFFGHTAIEGVILWDFWEGTLLDPNKALISTDLTFEESGERWSCLVNNEWTTNVNYNLEETSNPVTFRGFKGDYQIVVKRNGESVQRELFTLGDSAIDVSLTITNSIDKIKIPERENYVPECISHRDEKTFSSSETLSNQEELTCQYRNSDKSGLNEDDFVSVGCQEDEILTGCLSYRVDKRWTRRGERIEIVNNQTLCTAYNGKNILYNRAVRAIAICCKTAGLKCDYRKAGPSSHFDGAKAEARCSSNHVALGCSSYSQYPISDGVKPNDDITSCIAQSGPAMTDRPAEKSGSEVNTVCCEARNTLRCETVESRSTSTRRKSKRYATCPKSKVMTGCNAYATDGKAAGAQINYKSRLNEHRCQVINGDSLPSGATGPYAVATCCSV